MIETQYCAPVGHRQVKGDYVESWQPQAMSPLALERAQTIALRVTSALGGVGIFGVELFVQGRRGLVLGGEPAGRTTPGWSPW